MLENSIAERLVNTIRFAQSCPGDDGVQLIFLAAQAVIHLSTFGKKAHQRLRSVGALATVVDLLRTHIENAPVVTVATNALNELMKGHEPAQREAKVLDAVRLLQCAAWMHQDEPKVFRVVSLALGFFDGMQQGEIPVGNPQYMFSEDRGCAAAEKKSNERLTQVEQEVLSCSHLTWSGAENDTNHQPSPRVTDTEMRLIGSCKNLART